MNFAFSLLIIFYHKLETQACDSVEQVEISEYTTPGHVVTDLSNHILRLGSNIASFNLYEDSEFFYFLNGRIILRKTIDREEYCSKSNRHQTNINIECCRGDCCIFIGVISNDNTKKKFYVRVKVLDVNDNSPIFSELIYYTDILENTKISTRIRLPIATDADDPPFGVESYDIEKPNENFDTYFKLMFEDTLEVRQPVIVVKHQIDRETIDRIEFTLVASDGGKPPKKGKTKIVIKVLDENDNEPVLSQFRYEVKVKENEINGASLLHIKVEDKDAGTNGKSSVYFSPTTSQKVQNTFQLTQTFHGAELKLISKLDYEKVNRFSFHIVAKDHGHPPRSSSGFVEVLVTNVNDSPPKIVFYQSNKPISKQFARIYIDEGITKDLVICFLKVSDEDNTADSISCDVDSTLDSFYLSPLKTNAVLENKKSYELKTKIDFDRESKIVHYVSVVCSDSDDIHQLKETNKLEIIVRDINDNAPVFTNTHYYGFVKENRINELVSIQKDSILATDKDEGENGTIEYFISEVSDEMKNHFTMDKNTAVIKVVIGLNFELINKISIIVTARDLGVPSRSSTAKLVVNVKDTNDNQPEVESTFYTFEVYENEPVGTFVGKINVTDKDTDLDNKKIIMKIKNSGSLFAGDLRADQIFLIDNDNCKIYTKVILDREKHTQITFSIILSNPNPLDFGNERVEYNRQHRETVEIPISVIILDKNDNNPIMVLKDKQTIKAINPEVSFYTSSYSDNKYHENCVSFPYVFIDPDSSENGKVRVTMKGSDHFILNVDHGMICVVDKMPEKGLYRCVIIAEDGEYNNSRNQEFMINIFVKDNPNDLNNNKRLFSGNNDLRTSNDHTYYRNNDRNLQNHIIYIIIGSIAAILFLLLLIILFKFRKYLSGERNFEINTEKNLPDTLECQNFFDCIPETKYNDLTFPKNLNPDYLRSQYQFPSMDSKINEKYESTDAILSDSKIPNSSTKQVAQHYNYQSIATQCLPENLHFYHSLTNENQDICYLPQQDHNNYSSTKVFTVDSCPVFVNSQSTSTIVNGNKTKAPIPKSSFQSTFV